MSGIYVHINAKQAMVDLENMYAHLGPATIGRGIVMALNKTAGVSRLGGGGVRSMAAKDILKTYNMKFGYVRNTMMPIMPANKNTLQATISLSERTIPLMEFKGTRSYGQNKKKHTKFDRRRKAGGKIQTEGGVMVEVIKGHTEKFRGAFIINRNYGKTVVHRSYKGDRGAYGHGKFLFRHARINKRGSDLPLGGVLTVSPLHALFRDVISRHVEQDGGQLLIKNLYKIMSDLSNGLIKDHRRGRHAVGY